MINAEEIVLPCQTCVGKLVPISAVLVTLADPELSARHCAGISSFAGEEGRRLLRDLLHRYRHVFPAPGEPVTGWTTSVQHKILTSDARPVRCGPRSLALAGL